MRGALRGRVVVNPVNLPHSLECESSAEWILRVLGVGFVVHQVDDIQSHHLVLILDNISDKRNPLQSWRRDPGRAESFKKGGSHG
jgi:hypothetical protein